MNSANGFHIGQLVTAADPVAMSRTCATYTCKTTYGFIVAIDVQNVTVEWIDAWGPQYKPYPVHPQLLCAATLTAGVRSQALGHAHIGRHHNCSSAISTPNGAPCLEIRELKIWANGTRERPTGLRFHTVDEANTALLAIAVAHDANRPTCRPDLASVIPGAYIVAVYWAMHTAVYRLDRNPASYARTARPIALAG
ncbi:hypothetical protein SKC41_29950 [Mycobacterium sp. 050128]|uniref:hypothetical protein n=1 Tax=Mycobacterium sp. 050128 TaxID=3096112 RepID=UPI002ED9293E